MTVFRVAKLTCALISLGVMTSGCALLHMGDPPPPPEVIQMSEAEATSVAVRTSLDYFYDQLRRGHGERFFVRTLLPVNESESEVIWVADVQILRGVLTGKIAQTPRRLSSKKGTATSFPKESVVDWIIQRKGTTYGGFTERPKL